MISFNNVRHEGDLYSLRDIMRENYVLREDQITAKMQHFQNLYSGYVLKFSQSNRNLVGIYRQNIKFFEDYMGCKHSEEFTAGVASVWRKIGARKSKPKKPSKSPVFEMVYDGVKIEADYQDQIEDIIVNTFRRCEGLELENAELKAQLEHESKLLRKSLGSLQAMKNQMKSKGVKIRMRKGANGLRLVDPLAA